MAVGVTGAVGLSAIAMVDNITRGKKSKKKKSQVKSSKDTLGFGDFFRRWNNGIQKSF